MCKNVSKTTKTHQNISKIRSSNIDLRGELLVNEVVNYLRSKYE